MVSVPMRCHHGVQLATAGIADLPRDLLHVHAAAYRTEIDQNVLVLQRRNLPDNTASRLPLSYRRLHRPSTRPGSPTETGKSRPCRAASIRNAFGCSVISSPPDRPTGPVPPPPSSPTPAGNRVP